MPRFKTTLFFLCVTLITYSQPFFFAKQWDYHFGGTKHDVFYSIFQAKNGDYILGSSSNSDSSGNKAQQNWGGSYDLWLLKTDSSGTKLWDRRYGGTGLDAPFCTRQTADGGYIMGGPTLSGLNGDKSQPSWGDSDYFIVKTDSAGNKQWDRRFGGSSVESLNDVIQTRDMGYLLGGYSSSSINGDKSEDNRDPTNWSSDMWIVKTDSTGIKLWDKRFGGSETDAVYHIVQSEDGGYLLVGTSNSRISGDKTEDNCDTVNEGHYDIWIVKTDSNGAKQWDKRLGGKIEEEGAIIVPFEFGYLLGCWSASFADCDKTISGRGFWIVALDFAGNKLWEKVFTSARAINGFARTSDNGYIISGISDVNAVGDKTENNLGQVQVWIVKTDSLFNKQWDKTIFTNQRCYGYAIQTNDGCYAVAAHTTSNTGGYKSQLNWDTTEATYDIWLLKFCMDSIPSGFDKQTVEQKQILVYPNPFTSDVSIALTGSYVSTATFTISNTIGQVVYQQQENNLATGYTKMIDLSYLPNGVYFVEVSTAEGNAVQRVVKQ